MCFSILLMCSVLVGIVFCVFFIFECSVLCRWKLIGLMFSCVVILLIVILVVVMFCSVL